jgi:peptidoglycan/xylan/chitin deacetylase (PgdA/CDA1 family)
LKHNIVTFTFITVFALSGIIFWETGFAWIIFIAIAVVYFALTAYGSFKIQANYFLKSINTGKKKAIALTFDDGPEPGTTPRILDVLKEKNVKATFFVIGKKALKHPELLRRIVDEGHIIGNHTFSHSYFLGFFSKSKLTQDIEKCNEAIAGATGKSPLFFRPPFGVTNPIYATVLKELHLHSIGWSLRSLDTCAENKYQIINKIIAKLNIRDIVLLHDNLRVTADSIEDVIEHCLQKRIKIVPLSQLIEKEPYENI